MVRFSARRGVRAAVVAAIFSVAWLAALTPAHAEEEQLIWTTDVWSYFKGEFEPERDWMEWGFDDRDWETGGTPIGDGESYVTTTIDDILQDTAGGKPGYWSLYIRSPFYLENAASVTKLRLNIRYDDGFVCYINGVEAARAGLTGTIGQPVPFNTAASNRATEDQYQSIQITKCEVLETLLDGENVIAIQGHNTTLGSGDFILDPELFADDLSICLTNVRCEDRGTGAARVRWTRVSGIRYDAIEVYRNGELIEEDQPSPTSSSFTDDFPAAGENVYTLIARACGNTCGEDGSLTCTIVMGAGGTDFRRGDANGDGGVNISDAVGILGHLFQGQAAPSCLDAADVNDDSSVNLSDPIFLLGTLFQGKEPVPPPGIESCGADPSEDELADCEYAADC